MDVGNDLVVGIGHALGREVANQGIGPQDVRVGRRAANRELGCVSGE